MWSQLRAIYTFSALYNKIERRQEWLDVAEQIFAFVQAHGRDENGNWVFLVDKEGRPLEGATSIYTDAFAIYGFTELARANGSADAVQLARETYANVQKRLGEPGSFRTAPHPIPTGLKAHGVAMTFALAFDELGDFLQEPAIRAAGLEYAEQVMNAFRRPEYQAVREFVRQDGTPLNEPPGLTIVPGHALESMWFMLHIYQKRQDQERLRQAIEAIHWHIESGWDTEYGGIVQARAAEGSRWEKIADWKIWWPQVEGLYALLLAYSISHEAWCLEWFERVHTYAFSHYPVPRYGEWIQNLDREGNKLDAAVALPVKDPFHLARALIHCIGLLEGLAETENTAL
jgi:N-acylglucosamine 2-epimerase